MMCMRTMLNIDEAILEQAARLTGVREKTKLVRMGLACQLFHAHRLSLWQAAQWAQLSRVEMEAELLRRSIPLYEVTEEQLSAELAAMDRLGIPG
ncbi:MAG: UPF0175 family protein [Patescibacteria group bacterium]|nr:UPF0175 family protein [Patescibacteria group bacterium]